MLSGILQSLPALLALDAAAMLALSAAAVAISCRFYRRGHEEGPLLPMTIIRPMRGADEGLEENLRSVIDADHEGVTQNLFAMETADDPAYPIAKKVAAGYPERDIHVVLTGPSGPRMGKIHNMIEALKAAKREVAVFSDADMRPDRDVLIATSNAFAQGADAASALPDATGNAAPTDALVGICFNHFFMAGAALLYRLGLMTPMAGGWLACRKEFIRKIGGLESLEDRIADDYAISMAARKIGAKAVLLPRFAKTHERGGSLLDLFRHTFKWTKIIRSCAPIPYMAIPFVTPVFLASAALILACISGKPMAGYALLLAAVSLSRGLLAFVQDRYTASSLFPLWIYAVLPLADVASIGLWLLALFSRTLEWRGKRYRLRYGGRVEVLRS